MKKIGIIMTFVALFAATSCGTLSNVSDTAAATSGTACARALVSLRASQKAGTLSVTNVSDISNMLIVINAYNTLKANKGNNNFRKSFAAGMVAGGSGIITNSNVNTIINVLLATNGLGTLNSNNISSSNNSTKTFSTVLDTMK